MASIADLKLTAEKIDHDVTSMEDMPEQLGMRPRMLQPGPYVFQLPPSHILKTCFDAFDAEGKDKKKHQYIAASFKDEAMLTVVQAPDAEVNGTSHRNRIANNPRPRGKKEDPTTKWVSDFDYLLQALGEKALPKTNPGYADALVKHGGARFGAEIDLNWSCNANRPVRMPVDDTSGQLQTLDGQEGRELQNGCGSRYYQKDILPEAKEDGKFPNKVTCQCGAILYANENLTRFRAIKSKPAAEA